MNDEQAQALPLVPLGRRITREAEAELFARLEAGWPAVLVREYSTTNTATTVAYKLTRHKRWNHQPPAGKVLEFYTRAADRNGPYGVWGHFVPETEARPRG